MQEQLNLLLMNELPFTGERFVPNIGGEIELEHIGRYYFAYNLIEGKCVLDIASGEGYGSVILARKAAKVVGVEIAEDVVAYSKRKYADIKNLTFSQGSCLDIPCEDNTFDVVVSFETLEHIVEHDLFLSEIKRVLKEDGMLVISTPNTSEYSNDDYQNEFHALELNESQFKALLDKNFEKVSYFNQNVGYVSYILPSEMESSQMGVASIRLANEFPKKYLIALCKPNLNIKDEGGLLYIDPQINLTKELHEGYKIHLNNWEKIADDLRAELTELRTKQGNTFGRIFLILSKIYKGIFRR